MDDRTSYLSVVALVWLGALSLVGAVVCAAVGITPPPSLGNVAVAAVAGILALSPPAHGTP